MEAIIRTNDINLFQTALNYLMSLHISVVTKEDIAQSVKSQQKKPIDLNDFSFYKSMEASKNFKGSLCDAVIQARQEDYR